MIIVMHLLTRGLFAVPFEWRRLTQVVLVTGAITVADALAAAGRRPRGVLERGAALLAIPVRCSPSRASSTPPKRSRGARCCARLRRGSTAAEPAEVEPMRVHVVDPSAFTPPYDHVLCAALARAGAEVALITSRFDHGRGRPRRASRCASAWMPAPARPGSAARGR